jgi:hypothetical protein
MRLSLGLGMRLGMRLGLLCLSLRVGVCLRLRLRTCRLGLRLRLRTCRLRRGLCSLRLLRLLLCSKVGIRWKGVVGSGYKERKAGAKRKVGAAGGLGWWLGLL